MLNRSFLKKMTIIVSISLICSILTAADWPNYRGPDYNGFSKETGWGESLGSKEPQVLWTKEIGKGYSSIIVHRGNAYAMGNSKKDGVETDTIFCFDAVSGKEAWTYSYPCELAPKYYKGGTLSSPTADGDRVYTLSKMGDLFCFNAATGDIVWKKQVNKDMGFEFPTWHFSSSGLIYGDMIIYNLGTAGLALNKMTGKLIWENGKGQCGYATPVPCEINGKKQIVIFGKETVMGLVPSNGSKIWEYPWKTQHYVNAADPIVFDDKVFISSGYNRGCSLIRVNGSSAAKIWENKELRNHMNCTMLYKDHLYGFDENNLKCVDVKTGEEMWSDRSMGKGALMMSVDGRMIITSDKSELVIAKADPSGFKTICRSQIMPKDLCWTVPTLANGRIYARNAEGAMSCVDVSK